MNVKKIFFFTLTIPLVIILFFSFFLLLGYWFLKNWQNSLFPSLNPTPLSTPFYNATSVMVFDKELKLILALTPSEQEKGLSQIKTLDNFDGMLFLFNNKRERVFWNKDTFLDLILYWVDDNRVIKIDYLPSIEKTKTIKKISSGLPVNRVIEYVIKQNDYFFLLSPLPNEKISFPLHIKGLIRTKILGKKLILKIYDENRILLAEKNLFIENISSDDDLNLFETNININLAPSTTFGFLEFYTEWGEKFFTIPLKFSEIEKPIYQSLLKSCPLLKKSI